MFIPVFYYFSLCFLISYGFPRASSNFFTDARSCTTCDKVLAELEKIDDDTDHFGVDFVKINDKRLAKQYGIKNFPALTYFREKEPIIYEGKYYSNIYSSMQLTSWLIIRKSCDIKLKPQ